METNEYEQEFERRLFDLLRTYSQYAVTKRKIQALSNDPAEYIRSGTLLVPGNDALKESVSLDKAKESLMKSLADQALSIGEPLTGVLPPVKRYDLTYTPKVINEMVDAVCQFVTAATTTFATSVVEGDVNIYDDDGDRY